MASPSWGRHWAQCHGETITNLINHMLTTRSIPFPLSTPEEQGGGQEQLGAGRSHQQQQTAAQCHTRGWRRPTRAAGDCLGNDMLAHLLPLHLNVLRVCYTNNAAAGNNATHSSTSGKDAPAYTSALAGGHGNH